MMSVFTVEAVSMPIHDLKSKYVSLKIHFPIVNDTSNQSFLKPEFCCLLGMPRAVVLSILGVGSLSILMTSRAYFPRQMYVHTKF